MAKQSQQKTGPVSHIIDELAAISEGLGGLTAQIDEMQRAIARISAVLRNIAALDAIVNALSATQGEGREKRDELVSPDTGWGSSAADEISL